MRRAAVHVLAVFICLGTTHCGTGFDPDPVQSEPVTFPDETFNAGEWNTVLELFGPGGTASAEQVAEGGHPGAYRRISITLNSTQGSATAGQVAVFSIKPGASYTPSTQGAIRSVDYSEDSILLVGGGGGQTSAPALRQNGTIYTLVFGGGAFGTPDGAWTAHSITGLEQDDFRTLTSADEHPDFSANGTRIEFGFMRAISTPAGNVGGTRTGGIDNWEVTVNR
jgi:hypothetical protein